MSAPAALRSQVDDLVSGLGFSIVEIAHSVVKGRSHVNLVVYRPEGITIDQCAEIHRTVMPRLELVMDDRDVALQVSSPGIDRVIKDASEYSVFAGKGVRVLRRSTNEWCAGVIVGAGDSSLEMRCGTDTVTVAYDDIQKAKLDYSQEVR